MKVLHWLVVPCIYAGFTVTKYKNCDQVHGYWSDWGEWTDCFCKEGFNMNLSCYSDKC